jgi:hypothetical protein
MILITHALVGAAIGKNIPNAGLLIPLALAFHFALDRFRHGEYVESFDSRTSFRNSWWKISLDILGATALLSFLIYFGKLGPDEIKYVLLGSFFSLFPDGLTVLYWKFKFKFLHPIYRLHSWVHRFPRFSKEREWTLRNAWNDILISALAILVFIFL